MLSLTTRYTHILWTHCTLIVHKQINEIWGFEYQIGLFSNHICLPMDSFCSCPFNLTCSSMKVISSILKNIRLKTQCALVRGLIPCAELIYWVSSYLYYT